MRDIKENIEDAIGEVMSFIQFGACVIMIGILGVWSFANFFDMTFFEALAYGLTHFL